MAVKVREWKGAWWVFTDYKGRRKARRVGEGKAGKRAAEAAAEKIAAKLALGDLSPLETATPTPPVVTFRAYVTRWLDGSARLRCKPSTVATYRRTLTTHWLPAFGDLPLSALSRERIKTTLGGLADGLRATTIRNGALVALQSALSAAVEDGVLPANPAARLAKFVRSDVLPQERIVPFTREELRGLLEVAEQTAPAAYPALLTLARTGLRFGELAGLQPGDLDFRGRAVWVRRGIYRQWESTPKSGRGRRVDMSQQLAAVLQGALTVREAEAILSGQPAAAWLFPGQRGGPLNHRHFLKGVWRPLLSRAGLRHRPLHQLRHTFASLLIGQGESLAYVRDQLGHHSIKLTVDTYGHLIPGANRQAVDRLDDATPRNPHATAAVPSEVGVSLPG